MKKLHRLQWSLLAVLCLATAARADIVILKSGEKFEGRIHDDTPESLKIEYHLTPKIKDDKLIMKSDIKEIKRQTAAEVEFEERNIKSLLPTPDLLTASDYEAIIQDKLRTFVAKYPGTPEAAQAEKMIATLAEEKSKVQSGQLKMENKWLDATTVKREAYNIDAFRQRMQIKAKEAEVNDMHYLNALREFEKLRKDYGASPYFALEIPDALDLLKKYETQLTTAIGAVSMFTKKRDEGLRSAAATEREMVRRKIDEEVKAHKATYEQQTKDRVKWKDIYPYDDKGLKEALATVIKERTQLQSLDLSALERENQDLMSLIKYLADGNLTEARIVYDQLNKQQNLVNKSMLPGLAKQIEALAKQKADDAKLSRKVVVTEKPADSTAPTTDADNPVKKAMEEIAAAKKEKAKDKGANAKPGPGGAAKKSDDKKAPSPTIGSAAPDESGGLSDYIPAAGGGLVLIILIAWFLSKRKKDKEA